MKLLNSLIFIFISAILIAQTRLDDLDKNPIGSYGGQALFGGSVSLGIPSGTSMSAEDEFAKDTTYTFEEQEITRTVVISHVNYSISLFAEYLFVDRFGARLTMNRNVVLQRTHFGKNYKNESFPLYQDVSFLLGPTAHLTIRESWDAVLVPQIGYALASYDPAPCLDILFDEFSQDSVFDQGIFVYGAELHGMYFFDNGIFISAGVSYTHIDLNYDSFTRTTPEPSIDFNNGSNTATLGLTRFLITVGYSLFN
jgi:hypothetical protein